MRRTLEDLYFGNITPNEQQMAPDSELKKAVDRVAQYESQLAERLNEDEQLRFAEPENHPARICSTHRPRVSC